MAYKLSDRHHQNNGQQSQWGQKSSGIDYGKLAGVFLGFGILSLFTAWVFSFEPFLFTDQNFKPTPGQALEIGPIQVRKFNEVYSVSINADLPVQSWSFVQGEVLDGNKQYLFAFGQELWHERGRDSDGTWQEADDAFAIKITFPKPGQYFLKFNTESNKMPTGIRVRIAKRLGSSIPHLWFGVFLMLVGLTLNEVKNKTFAKAWGKANS